MITRIYHKKNELFQIEFYQDEKCTNLIKDLPYSENATAMLTAEVVRPTPPARLINEITRLI